MEEIKDRIGTIMDMVYDQMVTLSDGSNDEMYYFLQKLNNELIELNQLTKTK